MHIAQYRTTVLCSMTFGLSLLHRTNAQSNLTKRPRRAAHGPFSRIRRLAPLCTPYVLPWTHPSPHPKRHVDRFSRFCTAHDRRSLYFTMGRLSDTVSHKIYTSYFVTFRHSLLQVKCSWSGVFLQLGFCCKIIVDLALSASHFPCRKSFPLKIVHSHGGSGPYL